MLICARKGTEEKIIEIFEKWELDCAVIGEVTDTGLMELYWHGKKVAEVPVDPVSEEAPVLDRPTARPKYLDAIRDVDIDKYELPSNQEAFETIVKSIEVVDKGWVYEQYDSMVQTNTIKKGGDLDGSVIRVKENGRAIAMSSDCNPRYCYIDPKGGAAAAVIESGRNVAMTGARPLAITDCLNYGNPENPEVMWQFAQGCEGIKEACKALNTPVTGGNVSLYNETNGVSVFPTPTIAMVGVNDDQHKVLPSAFRKAGDLLLLIGETRREFGGSIYLKELFKTTGGTLPAIDYDKELALWDLVIEANRKGLLEAAKDLNVGGLAIAAAKMAAVGGMGAKIEADLGESVNIFSESFSRALLEVAPENAETVAKMARERGLACQTVGTVGGDILTVHDVSMPMEKLDDIYYNTFQRIIEQDL
jgi:phosphoribosylformylglycinamidine synthase